MKEGLPVSQYNKVFNFLPDSAIILDEHYRISDANKAILMLTGYRYEQLKGMNLADFILSEPDEYLPVIHNQSKDKTRVNIRTATGLLNVYLSAIEVETKETNYILCSIERTEDTRALGKTLDYRLKIEALIAAISTRFMNLSVSSFDELVSRTLTDIGHLVDTNRCYLYRWQIDKFVNTHEWVDGNNPPMKDVQNAEDGSAFQWIHNTLRKNKIVQIPSLDTLDGWQDTLKSRLEYQGIKSTLAVPIMSGTNGLIGFLGFDEFEKEKTWDEEDIGLLRVIGEVFANAFDRLDYERNLQEVNDRLMNLTTQQEKLIKERTRSLTETNDRLSRAVKELDLFVYRAAHDLKGPIKRLLGLTEVAKHECEELKSKDFLKLFEKTAREMDRELTKLLTANEISAYDPELTILSLADFIRKVAGEVHAELSQRPAELVIGHLDHKELHLLTSPYLLRIVLQSIIENAIIFSTINNHPGVIHIDFRVSDSEVVITVRDNGTGIDPDIMPRVTEMFYRGSNESIGNGLGLFLAERAITKLSGSMNMTSQVGEFTEVNITLPKK